MRLSVAGKRLRLRVSNEGGSDALVLGAVHVGAAGPDGTVLPQPLTSDQLYNVYGNSWRVSQATSLFDYGSGQTTQTFTDLNFPVDRRGVIAATVFRR